MPSRINTSASLQARRVKEYKDLDLNFIPNPLTGDLSILSSVDAVKTAVKNVIMTKFGEKRFNHLFGSQVCNLLFENFDAINMVILKSEIVEAIKRFEPRAFLVGDGVYVSYTEEQNELVVKISFGLTNEPDKVVEFNFYLERVR
jgi:phage baseplate assembly protein W